MTEILEPVDVAQRREAEPITVAGNPMACAIKPLSNAPSSLDAPMNTFSTAITRPRFSSGVTSGTSEPRMYTLTMSAPARIINATNAIAYE